MKKHADTPKMIVGVASSPGICRGRAFVIDKHDLERKITKDRFQGTEKELARLAKAKGKAINKIRQIIKRTNKSLGSEAAHIFRSQQTILEDSSTMAEIESLIQSEQIPAAYAVKKVFDSYLALFRELDDSDYNKARASDIEDVARRLTLIILGLEETSFDDLEGDQIIISEELFPSETAILDPAKIKGFITEKGGITSHVAILAKNMGIPAAVGVSGAVRGIANGQDVFLDTTSGSEASIYIEPDADTLKDLTSRLTMYQKQREALKAVFNKPPVTLDGFKVQLSANIGSVREAELAISNGAKSVGLFRTEFLFLGKKRIPGEDEQYRAYRDVGRLFAPEMVLIRTLDVGGDKSIPALSIANEANPFLGYRGLRVSLGKPEVLKSQLRAIFRANENGNLKIMYPMVSAVEELKHVAEIRDSVVTELKRDGERFDASMEIGIMIELPSTLLVLEDLLQYVDFFSIGTNDLTQYLYGTDRLNETVSEYYKVFGPALLRAIAKIVETTHQSGKWVGICGELAGMPDILPFLIGLGIDELSMSAGQLGEAISKIRSLSKQELSKTLVPRILSCKTESEVLNCLSTLKKV